MTTPALTRAEYDTLRTLAHVETTAATAAERGIAKQTVKNELSRAYKKLGVRSRTGAFRQMGWLHPA